MKFLLVRFSNGEEYVIPAEVIADARAKYYATVDERDGEDYKKTYEQEFHLVMGDELGEEILDWAGNNTNWVDVKDKAKLWNKKPVDYDDEWSNAEKSVVEL